MKPNIERRIEIEQFIRIYLSQPDHPGTDVLDAEFHAEFTKHFGGRITLKNYGASPNWLAMWWLKNLYNQGILDRGIIGLHFHEQGFPNWVYSYQLKRRNDGRSCTNENCVGNSEADGRFLHAENQSLPQLRKRGCQVG